MAVSRKAMTEGIRTPSTPGTLDRCSFTIPQSKIRDFCQLPLHKGAVGCSRTSASFWLAMTFFFGSPQKHPKSRNMEKAIGALRIFAVPLLNIFKIPYSSDFSPVVSSAVVSSAALFCAATRLTNRSAGSWGRKCCHSSAPTAMTQVSPASTWLTRKGPQ